jgi:RimJ/RimL family protein N-acetyltransferase
MPDQIVTDRLVIRPYRAEDATAVVTYLADFEVSKWLAKIAHPFTMADLRLTQPDGSSRWPDGGAITQDGALIGGISATPEHFGYWIGPPFHGRGFATEAGRAMVDRLFQETDAPQIVSGYFEGNAASRRVLEKLGFAEVTRNLQFSEARGAEVPNVEMRLTRATWERRA